MQIAFAFQMCLKLKTLWYRMSVQFDWVTQKEDIKPRKLVKLNFFIFILSKNYHPFSVEASGNFTLICAADKTGHTL